MKKLIVICLILLVLFGLGMRLCMVGSQPATGRTATEVWGSVPDFAAQNSAFALVPQKAATPIRTGTGMPVSVLILAALLAAVHSAAHKTCARRASALPAAALCGKRLTFLQVMQPLYGDAFGLKSIVCNTAVCAP